MHNTLYLDAIPLDRMMTFQKDVALLENMAKEHGLVGKLVEVRFSDMDPEDAFTSNMDGVYWITAKNQEDLDRVLDSIKLVEKGLREPYQSLIYQKILDAKFSEVLDTRINIAPLTDNMTNDDIHAFVDECFHRINDMDVIWKSFGEFNLIPPEKITYTTLAILKDNIIQRFKPYLTNAEYTTMTKLAKKNCENAIERFEKNKGLIIPTSLHQPHFVDKKYILENRINYFPESVSPEFVEFMKRKWDKVPNFYMSIDKKPYIDKMNYSASALDESKRYVSYQCMVPKKFANLFYAWKIGFWAENGNWPICTLDDLGGVIGPYDTDGNLKPADDQVKMFALTVENSWTFFPELKKSGVKVAIYQGELKQPVTNNPMYFLYNTKDEAIIQDVLKKTRDQAIHESWFMDGASQVNMKAAMNNDSISKQLEERRRDELRKDIKKLSSMQLCDKYIFSDSDLDYAKKHMRKSAYQDLYNRVRKEQRGIDDVVLDYGVSSDYADEIQVYGSNEAGKQQLAQITEKILRDRKNNSKNKGIDI